MKTVRFDKLLAGNLCSFSLVSCWLTHASRWKHASYKVRCKGCGRCLAVPARWATLGLGLPDCQATACEPGQVDCQRCETAHQAAWAGAAVASSFGEYFRIDEENKFISETAKFSLNVFSFPALKVDETRAGKQAEGWRRKHYIFQLTYISCTYY